MILLSPALAPPIAQADAAANHPLATVVGKGVQIYRCGPQGKWVFLWPEAALYREGREVGSHSAGPRWTWEDGSATSGKVLTSTPSSDPIKNIPSLDLAASPVPGKTGFLTPVTRVQRTDTEGGVPPSSGCDAEHPGELHRVPYSATYTFWVE